jgi:hypothetical protein
MLTKHDERKMPKNLGHIASLARSYTDTAIKTLAGIMMEPSAPARARIAAAAILLDRGWGKAKEMHEHSGPDSNPIKKIVHEIVYMPPPGQNVTIDNALRTFTIRPPFEKRANAAIAAIAPIWR